MCCVLPTSTLLGGKAHKAQPRAKGAHLGQCTPDTWTHSRAGRVHAGFHLWELKAGAYCLIQRTSAGIPCRPAWQGGHSPSPLPPQAQGPHLRLRLGPSPRPTPGPGIHPFSTARSLVRGPGPPCGPSKWPPLECDPRPSSFEVPDLWAAGHCFLLLLSLLLYLAAERGVCP